MTGIDEQTADLSQTAVRSDSGFLQCGAKAASKYAEFALSLGHEIGVPLTPTIADSIGLRRSKVCLTETCRLAAA
jgi:hypothetical protein